MLGICKFPGYAWTDVYNIIYNIDSKVLWVYISINQMDKCFLPQRKELLVVKIRFNTLTSWFYLHLDFFSVPVQNRCFLYTHVTSGAGVMHRERGSGGWVRCDWGGRWRVLFWAASSPAHECLSAVLQTPSFARSAGTPTTRQPGSHEDPGGLVGRSGSQRKAEIHRHGQGGENQT